MSGSSLYTILGIQPNSSLKGIDRAYRHLAMKWHPDRNPGDEAASVRFRTIQQAYDILRDPARRARYDATGQIDAEAGTPESRVATQVAAILSQAMNAVLRYLIEKGITVESQDVVKLMGQGLDNTSADNDKNLQQLQKVIAAYTDMAERFDLCHNAGEGDGENLLAETARAHAVAAGREKAGLAQRGEILQAAKVTLKKYKFRHLQKILSKTSGTSASHAGFNATFLWGTT